MKVENGNRDFRPEKLLITLETEEEVNIIKHYFGGLSPEHIEAQGYKGSTTSIVHTFATEVYLRLLRVNR